MHPAGNQRHVAFEIDLHEEGALLVGDVALWREKTRLERSRARLIQRGQHAGLVIRPKRANLDGRTVTQFLAANVVCSIHESRSVSVDQAHLPPDALDLNQAD